MRVATLESRNIEVTSAPRLLPLYARVLAKGNRYKEGNTLPSLRCDWKSFTFTEKALDQYRDICGIETKESVPLLFPHMFLGGLHLLLLSHPEFPLRPLGAVHSRNHIVQLRPLRAGEEYSASLQLGSLRRRPQGLEFDLNTNVCANGTACWSSVSTYLLRRKIQQEDPVSPLATAVSNLEEKTTRAQFFVRRDTGRRYGRLSGDINPIHMSALLAKLFGFKRDLAHGMWAAARGHAFFGQLDEQAPIRQDVAFKGPLYLGERVTVQVDPRRPGAFELYGGKNERPSIVGLVRNVTAGETLLPASR